MSRLDKAPLTIKMAVLVLPLVAVAVIVSALSVTTYKHLNKLPVELAVVTNTHSDPTAVLGESTYYPPGYMPTECPAPYTGTPPNCQAPAGSTTPPPTYSPPPSSTTPPPTSYPSTCPAPYTGTPPNCQAPAGSTTPPPTYSPPSSEPSSTPTYSQPPSGTYTPQSGAPQTPPTLTVNDPSSCMEKVLGADLAAKFRSGSFNPTPDQIAKVSNAGCFSASVTAGPPPGGQPGGSLNSTYNPQGNQSSLLASIPVAPPQGFQADSPMVTCAKQILGDRFGTQPSPEQMAQIQSKCFATAVSGQQIGFSDPSGQGGRGGPGFEGKPGTLPSLPPEVKACVIKAGISEVNINAIQRGQPPTAQQQQLGEGCFSKYAKDKGYTPPMLTPPDPTQPFDPNSKQNLCADLVAQTHGIRFSQIRPAIVSTWSADDVGKLRSCYGVAAAASASANSMVFAPTSPGVAISSTKLNCIQDAVGKDKLAAVITGTTTMSETGRRAVYNKCINPTIIAAGANPALLGVLAAMPPSDLESQFIPVDAKSLPAPSANSPDKSSKNAELTIGGEVNVAAGSVLPTKVDVFVKSTSQIFTVALKKVSNVKASWTLNVGQNKLAVGNHKAYTVATLADATQLRSPDGTFAIGGTVKATKSRLMAWVIAGVAALAVLVGTWFAWKWHKKQPKVSSSY